MRITHFLVHEVSRAKRTGELNTKGDPSYGQSSKIKCRVEKRHKRVVDGSGNEVLSEFSLVTDTLDVAVSDAFWFPVVAGEPADTVGDLDKARSPISIERATTLVGQAPFVVVYF